MSTSIRRPSGLRAGIVIGMALALVGIAVGTATGAATPFQQVIVVNPASSPIPVVQQGSVSVSNLPTTQSVTVGNFPATQAVSGEVQIEQVRVVNEYLLWENGETYEFDLGGTMLVTGLTLSDTLGSDSLEVILDTPDRSSVFLHQGAGFSRDFTAPVPVDVVRIACQNVTIDCDASITVFGY